MSNTDFSSWFGNLRQRLTSQGHRTLLVLQGEQAWSISAINSILALFAAQDSNENKACGCLIYGADLPIAVRSLVTNHRHHLGTENELVVFADDNFHADAFAALSGTIVAGGVMVWLPSRDLLADKSNLFIQRFWQKIQGNSQVYLLSEEMSSFPEIVTVQTEAETTEQQSFLPCQTQEQFEAVAAISKVMTGHRKRPLVLTADRGRGKSSALAIAVAQRLVAESSQQPLRIIVTAPHADALKIFFQQLQCSCPQGEYRQQAFYYQGHQVTFVSIEQLFEQVSEAHLVLVDEAAGIPVYILTQLVDLYHRIVFSSTQHGYEGAGRGFAVKFKQQLAKKTPDFRQYHISEPIRWAANDPLEQLIFDSFLLASQAEAVILQPKPLALAELDIALVQRQQLFADEDLLSQVFSTLIKAHYQTTPSDLKLLLNHDNISLFVAKHNEQVVAVALTIHEGEAEQQDVAMVDQSKRRLKDQFIPQSLYLHSNILDAFEYRYLRVMRIAVLEELQNLGIGGALLDFIQAFAKKQKVDLLATSFGATKELLAFWSANGYQVTRLGFTKDKASGEHSALLLQAVSKQGQQCLNQTQQGFYRQFCYLLTEQYRLVQPSVVHHVIAQWPPALLPAYTGIDKQVVEQFVAKVSLYDSCVYSLQLLLIQQLANGQPLDDDSCHLLIERVLQKKPIAELCRHYGFTGKKQLSQKLIALVTKLNNE